MWKAWLNGIIGIWLIVSSFIPSCRATWNLLIFGIIITILSFWTAVGRKE
ncbi:MAG: hypothetical protein DRQ02_05580 [Candidatus Latescibacterota bacterium]|nr:MAG: hypothetical protein DRQ02_05580 [Candidatus Latescibacterota bacterium]RKY72702.1 MAG: hypothetical protein DRQ24_04475 [Candidatus Latescibacterota bacterium]